MGYHNFITTLARCLLIGVLSGLSLAPVWAAGSNTPSVLDEIKARKELRIGVEAGYMPFEMIDKRSGVRQMDIRHGGTRRKGRQLSLMGFDIDMGIEMAKALGVKAVFFDTLWPSIIPALNLEQFDVIFGGMSVTEERKAKVDFADPFMVIGQTVLVNGKHKDNVKSYLDLNDLSFTVVSKPGTTGEAAVKAYLPKAVYVTAGTEMDGASRVAEGLADAFVYDFPFNAVFKAMNPSANLIFLDKPFTTEPLAWAIRKNDPQFLAWLNHFLKEIKQDGRFDQLVRKWFNNTDWFNHAR